MSTTTVRDGTAADGVVAVTRVRWGAGALAVAGVALAVYPALRPYPDSAAGWASPAWTAAHLLAVAGFVLLVAGIGAVWASVRDTRAERTGFAALVVTGGGVGLTLPYYGAEVFGLHVIGRGCASPTGSWFSSGAGGYGARSRPRGRTLDDGDRKRGPDRGPLDFYDK